MMTGNKICMQVGFDDVLNLPAALARGVEVDLDVPLWIDNGRGPLRSHNV